uniref:Uncharacterized protein n=1 Tax=Anguilla anguilla TaxID=7936 RepID=A0A0E9U3P9_ANGAN
MIITSSWIQTRPLSTWQLNTATKYPKSPKSTCNFLASGCENRDRQSCPLNFCYKPPTAKTQE